MSKVHKIKISNFKSIDEFEADFKGCTALVTGGNNTGKTSFLRGIPDRIRFVRPELMVRNGEKEGKGEMTLTTGERFVWEFDVDGRDKLTLFTTEGLKQSVTVDIGKRFFPPVFDIDKFLQSAPKSQVKQLQVIVGLDFTEIDQRYEKAYNYRTERNREAELYHVKLSKMLLSVVYVELIFYHTPIHGRLRSPYLFAGPESASHSSFCNIHLRSGMEALRQMIPISNSILSCLPLIYG